jgi:hypothetical protein
MISVRLGTGSIIWFRRLFSIWSSAYKDRVLFSAAAGSGNVAGRPLETSVFLVIENS